MVYDISYDHVLIESVPFVVADGAHSRVPAFVKDPSFVSSRADKIARCRKLLDVPPRANQHDEHHYEAERASPFEPPPCPCCGGRMRIIETFDGPLSRPYQVRRLE